MITHKIYIHHYYTYELFWYFCHGLKIKAEDVPIWTKENQYNKKNKITKEIEITAPYKNTIFKINFCNNLNWDKKDGYHLLDYSIYLLENNKVGDRGFNSNEMKKTAATIRELLNEKANNLQNLLHFMYIDWEGHDAYRAEEWNTSVNKNVQFFVDETYNFNEKPINSNFVFTNLFWSFIYPNTLGIREYYFFHDYLKYKNDYKYKINAPVRRVYGLKVDIIKKILELNNPYITITKSSFHESKQIHLAGPGEFIFNIDEDLYIQKRGYGIHDWGGEWNDNNMNENMWKMFGISEVVLLFEHSPTHRHDNLSKKYNKVPKWLSWGDSFITEKVISHILVGKPFIPLHYETIRFLENIFRQYNKPIVEFPIQYENLLDIIPYLDNITKDEKKWISLKDKLTEYVENLRTHIIDICNNNNSYLDYIITNPIEVKQRPTI